jgi:hypothetical protein
VNLHDPLHTVITYPIMLKQWLKHINGLTKNITIFTTQKLCWNNKEQTSNFTLKFPPPLHQTHHFLHLHYHLQNFELFP